ncbi:MAG: 3-keto-disaccharide hydrolase [Gammaproteobacteria bacterium]
MYDSVMDTGWVTLIDGEKGLENFNRVGDVNWRAEDGAIVGDKGKGGHLVTKKSYKDFQLKAEFWADHTTNSGIFMRCQDPGKITDKTCYEANIFDMRADQTYATGGIVRFAKVLSPQKAGGKWNTYDITVKGTQVTVVLNGVQTATLDNSQFAQGPITLQFGNRPPKGDPGGAIKWRKVQIKEL